MLSVVVLFFLLVVVVLSPADPMAWVGAVSLLVVLRFGLLIQARLAWSRAARQLGLKPDAPGLFRLVGKVDGHRVRITSVLVDPFQFTKIRKTRVSVLLGDSVPSDLAMLPPRTGELMRRLIGRETPETGDANIDGHLRFTGREVEVLARMDVETRRLIASTFLNDRNYRPKLVDRQLIVEQPRLLLRSERLEAMTRHLVALAARFEQASGRIAERLAENAEHDPNPVVREKNLRALLRSYRASAEARRVAPMAIEGPADDERFRLLGAVVLGPPAAETYQTLLEDDALDPVLKDQAIDELANWGDRPWALARLDALLAGPASAARLKALKLVAVTRHQGAVPRLLDLVDEVEGVEAKALAQALVRVGDESDERHWIGLLAHPSLEMRRRAVLALRERGTAAAIGPLNARRRVGHPTIKELITEVIDVIQARHGQVERGRLSLTRLEGDAGGLSMATESGGVSIVEDEDEG